MASEAIPPSGAPEPATPPYPPDLDPGAPGAGLRGRQVAGVALVALVGLGILNFFLAAAQTGFGPFIPVYLTRSHWSQGDIGVALSVGTAAALACQLPAGALIDALPRRRPIIAVALLVLAVSALAIGLFPDIPAVWTGEVLHAGASALLGPAIAALTLALGGQAAFGQRLGGNARYAALGSALAAAVLGATETRYGERMVFILTAALVVPAIAALGLIRAPRVPYAHHPDQRHPDHCHAALKQPRERREAGFRPWHVFRAPGLHVFAVCTVLFQLANAAALPLALNRLALAGGNTGFAVPGSIVMAALVTAAASPLVGRLAQSLGRRPVLMLGLAALPLRALIFAAAPSAPVLIAAQALDGVSGAVFGVLPALVAADYSRKNGYLNIAIASLGLAANLGAMFSTTIAGVIADQAGLSLTFVVLAAIATAALLLAMIALPETRLVEPADAAPAPGAA